MHLDLHDIDPRHLAINLRFKGKTVVHPKNRAAQEKIIERVSDWIEKDYEKWGEDLRWTPPRPAKMLIQFIFPTAANDVDGPVKRTMDAVERGINQILGKGTWNDNQVVDLRVLKYKGPPRMYITLTPAEGWQSNYEMRKELTHVSGLDHTTQRNPGCGPDGRCRSDASGRCRCLPDGH